MCACVRVCVCACVRVCVCACVRVCVNRGREVHIGFVAACLFGAVCACMQLLLVINGNGDLVCLSKDLEPIFEHPVAADEFGADAPVTVGTSTFGCVCACACVRVRVCVFVCSHCLLACACSMLCEQVGARKKLNFKGEPENWQTSQRFQTPR